MKLSDVRFLRRELEEYRALQRCLQRAGGWREAAITRRIEALSARLAEELWGVTRLIADIPETELRLIFELRYFRGLTWEEVAAELPTRLSPDGARMKHDRYLKKYRSGEDGRTGEEEEKGEKSAPHKK